MNIISVHIKITGRVQGVGYREAMRMVAQALDVTGWVRNLQDNSVEARLYGEEAMVERLITWCHNGPPGANVQYVEANLVAASAATEKFIQFSRLPDA